MYWIYWPSWCFLLLTTFKVSNGGDNDYNIVHRDGSYQFGYDTPDSYHQADANRNNIVSGQFGGRNPETGAIDSTIYTAGPRGYRPVGKNIHRKYDLNQNGPRPVGSPDDPYYDPYEDPSYKFSFKTRTYNRQESANRVGDVSGKYNYIDDVGEQHNVEFIAGRNTGFHVKTPYPDSNPRAYYGRLFFRGRGKPIPRGRTSIQRGLDGSYRFISAGPDQRRTEVSDSSGHVRGSYTYLDDKGVQHSVHYIAGPETGYRVLKNVKGPHLPTVYPFGQPEIIPPDFYDYIKDDVFDTAASGHVKPPTGGRPRPDKDDSSDFGGGGDEGTGDFDKFEPDLGKPGGRPGAGDGGRPIEGAGSAPVGGRPGGIRPPSGGGGFDRPSDGDALGGGGDLDEDSDGDFEGELFGPSGGSPRPSKGPPGPPKPTATSPKPSRPPRPGGDGPYRPTSGDTGDDGTYIPPGDANQDDGSYKPGIDESGLGSGGTSRPGFGSVSETPRPGLGGGSTGRPTRPRPSKPPLPPPGGDYDEENNGLFGSESNGRPPPGGGTSTIQFQGGECERCKGTIFRNVGDRLFTVPPGVSVRAHVQSIDLLPLVSKVPSPSEQYNEDMGIKTEQLNLAASDLVTNTTAVEASARSRSKTTTVPTTTVSASTETTTLDE